MRLNNAVVTHPATFVGPGDLVLVGGKLVDAPQRTRLWRYHKPDGLVTTHRDPQGRPTVFDKLRETLPRVISIGRLDLNSEGLLLLTNDGALARQLELPSTGWLRRYRVRVHGNPDPAALAALAKGVTIDGVRYGEIDAGLDFAQGRQRLAHRQPARGAQPRGAPRDGASRPGGDAADPHRLRPVPARRAAARRGGGGAGPRAARPVAGPARRPSRDGRTDASTLMRIVAGAWRGRALQAPPGDTTRPTADRVRQALFDMLLHAPWGGRDAVEGARVLDVFAGTGALGLEALSRGAAFATFIEQDRAALAALRANIATLRAAGRCRRAGRRCAGRRAAGCRRAARRARWCSSIRRMAPIWCRARWRT